MASGVVGLHLCEQAPAAHDEEECITSSASKKAPSKKKYVPYDWIKLWYAPDSKWVHLYYPKCRKAKKQARLLFVKSLKKPEHPRKPYAWCTGHRRIKNKLDDTDKKDWRRYINGDDFPPERVPLKGWNIQV